MGSEGVANRGRDGERIAVRFLQNRGFHVLARNWRSGRYEIDIVARDAGTVVFVEVRTRRPGSIAPEETVGREKRLRLARAASDWISAHPPSGSEYRFDIVSVVPCAGGPPAVRHLRDAFQAE